jgi:hypothetical protein
MAIPMGFEPPVKGPDTPMRIGSTADAGDPSRASVARIAVRRKGSKVVSVKGAARGRL